MAAASTPHLGASISGSSYTQVKKFLGTLLDQEDHTCIANPEERCGYRWPRTASLTRGTTAARDYDGSGGDD